PSEAGLVQLHIVVGVEVIHAQHARTAGKQPQAGVKTDEAGGPGDEDPHPRDVSRQIVAHVEAPAPHVQFVEAEPRGFARRARSTLYCRRKREPATDCLKLWDAPRRWGPPRLRLARGRPRREWH